MKEWEREAQLYLEQPDECPEIGTPPYLIHPLSKLAPTASWLKFRDKASADDRVPPR